MSDGSSPVSATANDPIALLSNSSSDSDSGDGGISQFVSSRPAALPPSTAWRAINQVEPMVETTSIITIEAPELSNSEEFKEIPGDNTVARILQKARRKNGNIVYKTKFEDGHVEKLSSEVIESLENGDEALQKFLSRRSNPEADSSSDDMVTTRTHRTRTNQSRAFKSWDDVQIDSDDEEQSDTVPRRRTARKAGLLLAIDSSTPVTRWDDTQDGSTEQDELEPTSSSSSSEESDQPRRSGRIQKVQKKKQVRLLRMGKRTSRSSMRVARNMRKSTGASDSDSDSDDSDESSIDILRSDVYNNSRKRKRGGHQPTAARCSGRQRNNADMREVGEEAIFRDSSDDGPRYVKVSGAKEIFKPMPLGNPFRSRHMAVCDVCRGSSHILGTMIFCQGCSLSYHKSCLGPRGPREHLVTKIGDEDFVLQCRRCINFPRRKDGAAPDLARCQDCKQTGISCVPFRDRKTPAQEQREREENGGLDPITFVSTTRIYNTENLMFRCIGCWRCWHFEHLPARHDWEITHDNDTDRAKSRFKFYSEDWKCYDCFNVGDKKVGTIVAWRPNDVDAYDPSVPIEYVQEDDKEYLIKWDGYSYFQVQWLSGAWVWGFTSASSRKAFFKKDLRPIMKTEDAVPEEFLRIDIVLDVKYTNIIDIRTAEIDRARIREVAQALIKYKGLGYEEAVWEKVPNPDDGDRWTDFVTAYNDWVLGRYTHQPKNSAMKIRLDKARKEPFTKLERKKQPENLTGGELMNYQLDGLNWIYHQWYSKQNGILADEMGLGKTIQIIAYMATMVQEHNCYPFLVVVPNSTCPNWRREIKQWAPGLRVVAYYGSSTARQMAYDYELYPNKGKDLHCHVVVTSYEAIIETSTKSFFKSVTWQTLIVDEGQRLKNDKSMIHSILSSFKIPFRLLLTGTPLQNNARELFNLLQFLDDTVDAEQMEAEYTNMTNENISKLHDIIRPYILRRTKAQVLTFLPPMGQIIVPVSMSVLQKRVYKSIMAKSPDLLRALFSSSVVKQGERASLNNILMQLRKCLCHPFVYSREIEERGLQAAMLHRNLVEASSKLQLLEILLPKLKERGHRVLIFSQFLNMLDIIEDFLDGLELTYQRLDGTINSLEKQRRIDEFNTPNSSLFAFLLSTRAGGVGINLATADTVIILDPDFNPHQDMQAVSRAHRIGQTNKVLCFQLMTRASAEEKIVQIGRKKMALDHVVIEELDAADLESKDVESILRFGAAELFNDDGENNIKYDDASVEALLDRSQIENTKSGADDSAESQYSFARVWANDQEKLEDTLEVDEETMPNPDLWETILKDRENAAVAEAAAKAATFGRGRRARVAVNYDADDGQPSREEPEVNDVEDEAPIPLVPVSVVSHAPRGRKRRLDDSDTDFRAEEPSEPEEEFFQDARERPEDLAIDGPSKVRGILAERPNDAVPGASNFPMRSPNTVGGVVSYEAGTRITPIQATTPSQQGARSQVDDDVEMVDAPSPTPRPIPRSHKRNGSAADPHWKRAVVDRSVCEPQEGEPFISSHSQRMPAVWDPNLASLVPKYAICHACGHCHPTGSCPLKVAGVEFCPLCGIAHFGVGRQCMHIRSETMVRIMLDQLRHSPEDRQLVDAATKYLRGVKGHLVQNKKRAREGPKQANGQPANGTNPTDGQLPQQQFMDGSYPRPPPNQLHTLPQGQHQGQFRPHPLSQANGNNNNVHGLMALHQATQMLGRNNQSGSSS